MDMPLVSVKMITYNHAPYIANAIERVLSQKTNFNFELVIGEDCSTDGTRDIVFQYAKKHPNIIKVITSTENVGMRKNGARTQNACRGKYIAYCEGDDYWHCDKKLQIQVNYLESHPECGLVCSDYDVFFTENDKLINNYIKYNGWKFPESLSVKDFVEPNSYINKVVFTCTVLARKKLIDSIKQADPYLHSNDHFKMGDTQLWAEISQKEKVHLIDRSLATYQILPESAANTKIPIKHLKFRLSMHQMRLYLCEKYDVDQDWVKFHNDRINHYLIRIAFSERNIALAEEFRTRRQLLSFSEIMMYNSIKYPLLYWVSRVLLLLKRKMRNSDPIYNF